MVNPSNMVMKDVPLDLCEPDERFTYRTTYDDVSDLAESIASLGQLEPAVGWEDPASGKCYVVAGIRRLMAARAAREKYGRPATFRVLLVPVDTPLSELWRIALEENLRRRNLTDIEVVRVLRRILSGELAGMPGLDEILTAYDPKSRDYLVKLAERATDEELEDFVLAEKWAKSSGVLLGKQYLHAYHMVHLLGQERYYRLAGAYFALLYDWRPDEDPVERMRYMRNAKLVTALAPIEIQMYDIGVQSPEGGWITPSLRQMEEKKKHDESGGIVSRAAPAREVSEEALERAKPPTSAPESRPSAAVRTLESAAPPRLMTEGAISRPVEVGTTEGNPTAPGPGTPSPEAAKPPRGSVEERAPAVGGAAEEAPTGAERGAGPPVEEASGAEEIRVFKVLLEPNTDEFDVTCPHCGARYHIEIVRRGSARSP
ncbi:MAG: ParB N-terminal domain-containing protein [Nitrososphaeria archaeon]